MEIERKWLVSGWPEGLEMLHEERQRQGYLYAEAPIVRIREEARDNEAPKYVLCIKSEGLLAREEIELEATKEQFDALEGIIGLPLIEKTRRIYKLAGGLELEVNLVDEGLPGQLMYTEIEFPSIEEAKAWTPEADGLSDYLVREVTEEPGQSMSGHWTRTRLGKA